MSGIYIRLPLGGTEILLTVEKFEQLLALVHDAPIVHKKYVGTNSASGSSQYEIRVDRIGQLHEHLNVAYMPKDYLETMELADKLKV